jgi:predicted metal-dependent HD superfamily phosphohydrolase
MSDPGLRRRFWELWTRLGGLGDGADAFAALDSAWAEPHRRYHGTDHLRDCLARLDEAPPGDERREEVEAALWYHDAVYRPGARDNEARSAEMADRWLREGGVPADRAGEVARLVRATDHTAPPLGSDPSASLVCDVDLSILGRDPEEFAEYETRIREEYRHVPAPVYRAGRAGILAALLRRDPLFLTAYFRDRYEAPARRNLRRAIEQLGQPPEM